MTNLILRNLPVPRITSLALGFFNKSCCKYNGPMDSDHYNVILVVCNMWNDAQDISVPGLRKTVVYPVKPKEIRENLNMSQQEFAKAYGIPLSTLRNWEQGRRKLDTTAIAYFKAIMKYPHEVMTAQLN